MTIIQRFHCNHYDSATYMDNGLCGGVGENEEIEGVIVVVDESSVDGLQ